ncbi:hypothetical protein Vafri_771 [Volvox africanus]|nr:hypothetical protein Vafri_771 [Volvox africanus]
MKTLQRACIVVDFLWNERLWLLVLALIAGLAVVASQLRATASSSSAHAGRPSVARSPPAAAADIAGPSSAPSSASTFGTHDANGGRDGWSGHTHGDGRGRGWGSSREGHSGTSPMAHWSVAATAGIAHRGASAELPEHTREAYELAVAEGADFIECDVVLTADLVPLCRHEPNLINSTDAVAKFPERWREYVIDGEMVAGIFSVDLTAAEVATLRAIQPWPFRNQSYNGRFRIATLADYLEVALSANRSVGIYPETKHPTWTNSLLKLRAANTSLEDILLDALTAAGFGAPLDSEAWMRRPIFLQSFEASSLRYLATRTCAPTVLLLGDWEGWVAPDTGQTLAQLTEDSSLAEIARWSAAVGPSKRTLVNWQMEEMHGDGMGAAEHRDRKVRQQTKAGGGGRYVSSGLVERFHAHGLLVHTYTVRPEPRFSLPHLEAADVAAEYELLLGTEVAADGVFTDHMPSLKDWMKNQNLSGSSSSSSLIGRVWIRNKSSDRCMLNMRLGGRVLKAGQSARGPVAGRWGCKGDQC